MTRKPVLALVALLIATTLTLLNLQRKRVLTPQPSPTHDPIVQKDSQHSSTSSEALAPSPSEAKTLEPSTASDFSAVQAEALRSFSSKRIDTDYFQSTSMGFESSLLIDGLPLIGARLFIERRNNGLKMAMVPDFKLLPSTPKHSHEFGSQAEVVAKNESLGLMGCEVLSMGSAREIWFYTGGSTTIVPAYAIEIFYRCDRSRKREDWIYADPSLEKLGTVKRRI